VLTNAEPATGVGPSAPPTSFPVPVGGVGGGARRTRSGTVVGPAWNRRERSGTVVAAAPTGLATISRMAGNGNCDGVDGGEADIDMQSQGSVHDTDKQMSDTVAANSRRGAGCRHGRRWKLTP